MDLGVAVRRGRLIKCKVCNSKGATLGCHVATCKNSAHLPCARFKKWHMDVRACLCSMAVIPMGILPSGIDRMCFWAAELLRQNGFDCASSGDHLPWACFSCQRTGSPALSGHAASQTASMLGCSVHAGTLLPKALLRRAVSAALSSAHGVCCAYIVPAMQLNTGLVD